MSGPFDRRPFDADGALAAMRSTKRRFDDAIMQATLIAHHGAEQYTEYVRKSSLATHVVYENRLDVIASMEAIKAELVRLREIKVDIYAGMVCHVQREDTYGARIVRQVRAAAVDHGSQITDTLIPTSAKRSYIHDDVVDERIKSCTATLDAYVAHPPLDGCTSIDHLPDELLDRLIATLLGTSTRVPEVCRRWRDRAGDRHTLRDRWGKFHPPPVWSTSMPLNVVMRSKITEGGRTFHDVTMACSEWMFLYSGIMLKYDGDRLRVVNRTWNPLHFGKRMMITCDFIVGHLYVRDMGSATWFEKRACVSGMSTNANRAQLRSAICPDSDAVVVGVPNTTLSLFTYSDSSGYILQWTVECGDPERIAVNAEAIVLAHFMRGFFKVVSRATGATLKNICIAATGIYSLAREFILVGRKMVERVTVREGDGRDDDGRDVESCVYFPRDGVTNLAIRVHSRAVPAYDTSAICPSTGRLHFSWSERSPEGFLTDKPTEFWGF
jgi:hypothetical protein